MGEGRRLEGKEKLEVLMMLTRSHLSRERKNGQLE